MTSDLPHGFVPYDRPVRVGDLGLGPVFDLAIRGYEGNDDEEVVARSSAGLEAGFHVNVQKAPALLRAGGGGGRPGAGPGRRW
jgi:hypothetical protein